MLTALILMAQVRSTETWTPLSVALAALLFAVAVAALVAWIVRVATRR